MHSQNAPTPCAQGTESQNNPAQRGGLDGKRSSGHRGVFFSTALYGTYRKLLVSGILRNCPANHGEDHVRVNSVDSFENPPHCHHEEETGRNRAGPRRPTNPMQYVLSLLYRNR
jgi:hypothetical protein